MKLTSDLLQFLSESDNMELLQELQQKANMRRRNALLMQHEFKIWEKDGCCYTHLPDGTKKEGRRLIKRRGKDGISARERIEDAIIEFYEADEIEKKKQKEEKLKLRNVYLEWMQYKRNHTESTAYLKRIAVDWNRFYENDPIADMPVTELNKLFLDNWIHIIIKDNHLTKKQYYNMSIILRQGLDYACEYMNVIENNPFAKVKIQKKMLRENPKPESETQVFSIDEEPIIIQLEKDKYIKYGSTEHLGIALLFSLGLRVGELAALKVSDFNDDFSYVNIHSMEITTFDTEDGIKYLEKDRIVVDYAKTSCGIRRIYVPKEARKIVEQIISYNHEKGYAKEEYLFIKNGKRIRTNIFQHSIIKTCKDLGIPKRSIHKIRKTYISALIDGNVSISKITEMAGHADKQTTYNNYCFDRFSKKETENKIEEALG